MIDTQESKARMPGKRRAALVQDIYPKSQRLGRITGTSRILRH